MADLGISTYNPIYFMLGTDGGFNAKFQLSFKYQLFSECGPFVQSWHIPSRLYLSLGSLSSTPSAFASKQRSGGWGLQ